MCHSVSVSLNWPHPCPFSSRSLTNFWGMFGFAWSSSSHNLIVSMSCQLCYQVAIANQYSSCQPSNSLSLSWLPPLHTDDYYDERRWTAAWPTCLPSSRPEALCRCYYRVVVCSVRPKHVVRNMVFKGKKHIQGISSKFRCWACLIRKQAPRVAGTLKIRVTSRLSFT